MLIRTIPTPNAVAITTVPLLFLSTATSHNLTSFPFSTTSRSPSLYSFSPMNFLNKLGFNTTTTTAAAASSSSAIAQSPDEDIPATGQQFAQFGAGCFWGVELAYQRVPGVTKTEVGYSQGFVDNPTYNDVCRGNTGHCEVVRVQFDPKECSYETLLDVFWDKHDPTTLNRQVCVSLN